MAAALRRRCGGVAATSQSSRTRIVVARRSGSTESFISDVSTLHHNVVRMKTTTNIFVSTGERTQQQRRLISATTTLLSCFPLFFLLQPCLSTSCGSTYIRTPPYSTGTASLRPAETDPLAFLLPVTASLPFLRHHSSGERPRPRRLKGGRERHERGTTKSVQYQDRTAERLCWPRALQESARVGTCVRTVRRRGGHRGLSSCGAGDIADIVPPPSPPPASTGRTAALGTCVPRPMSTASSTIPEPRPGPFARQAESLASS